MVTHKGQLKGGENTDGYTPYGYKLDGVEYATIDEAYKAQDEGTGSE